MESAAACLAILSRLRRRAMRPKYGGPGGMALALALFLLLSGGCRSRIPEEDPRDWYAIAGPAALPEIGISAGAGRIIDRTEFSDWSIEAEGVFEFLDDSDFVNDGRGGSGEYYHARLGVRRSLSPGHERTFFFGAGVAAIRATNGPGGEPLILEPEGNYYGAYAQAGFLTRLSSRWSAGPDMRFFVVGGHGVQFYPQFTWQFVFRF